MTPNLKPGALLLVVQQDRFGALQTSEEGALTGYGKYNSYPNNTGQMVYGDVIIYRPNGNTAVHPIVHRVIRYVDDTTAAATYHASHGGYITKGDHTRSRISRVRSPASARSSRSNLNGSPGS